MKPLALGRGTLSIEDVMLVSREFLPVELSDVAKKRIEKAHRFLLKKATSKETHYGVNTGFGLLSNVRSRKKI